MEHCCHIWAGDGLRLDLSSFHLPGLDRFQMRLGRAVCEYVPLLETSFQKGDTSPDFTDESFFFSAHVFREDTLLHPPDLNSTNWTRYARHTQMNYVYSLPFVFHK